MRKIVRRSRRARKILTEFELKNDEKLRILVDIWGNMEYAKKLGYHDNILYKPVLVNKDGTQKDIYKNRKGLPTLEELKTLYQDWKYKLKRRNDISRLRETATTLYELAENSTFFEQRQAHVIYQLLRITGGGPSFKIERTKDVDDLDIEMMPVIVVSFRGN